MKEVKIRDADWERMIEKHATRLKGLVEREVLKAAREELKRPEVKEYLKSYGIPRMMSQADYIAEEIWDAFENI